MMREVWETAEVLAKLGLTCRISRKRYHLALRVYRDGVRIGTLRFPLGNE